jgi:hypothetical protein
LKIEISHLNNNLSSPNRENHLVINSPPVQGGVGGGSSQIKLFQSRYSYYTFYKSDHQRNEFSINRRFHLKNRNPSFPLDPHPHSDGWFIGITPDLAGGVWVGAEDRSIHFQNLANGQGASMALPIWALFMQKV